MRREEIIQRKLEEYKNLRGEGLDLLLEIRISLLEWVLGMRDDL